MERIAKARLVKKDLFGKDVWWYVKKNGNSFAIVHKVIVGLKTPFWKIKYFYWSLRRIVKKIWRWEKCRDCSVISIDIHHNFEKHW